MPEWLTEPVMVQMITTLGLVITAILGGRKLNKVGRDAKEARDQTANTHETNLRDDLDSQHASVIEGLKEVILDIRGLRDDHQATRKDIGILHGAIRGVVRDITGLRETDSQARSELAAAVAERNEELNRVRLDIPSLIRQECQRKNH